MRIIGGEFKGRSFHPGKAFKARPTTDFAKENLFNILQHQLEIEDLKVLDIFAGTGSISYEFYSRGCRDITSVERNFNHYRFIRQSVSELGAEKNIRVIKANAFKFLERTDEKFNLIFADPPYELKELSSIPDAVFNNSVLKDEGFLIVEHPGKYNFENHQHFLEMRKYGSVHFSFFKK